MIKRLQTLKQISIRQQHCIQIETVINSLLLFCHRVADAVVDSVKNDDDVSIDLLESMRMREVSKILIHSNTNATKITPK